MTTALRRDEIASFDGTSISYLDSGAGDRVALLLHGFLIDAEGNFGGVEGISRMMAGLGGPPPGERIAESGRAGVVAAMIAAGFRVVAPDMRGHGQSGKPAGVERYRGRAMARDAIALLDHLGIDRCGVLGYSMGSLTTAHLMHLAPGRIGAAVLGGIGSWIIAGEPMQIPDEFPLPAELARPIFLEAFSESNAAALDAAGPGGLYGMVADAVGFDRRVASAVLRGQMMDPIAGEDLRAFGGPVLVLNGDQDVTAFAGEEAFSQYLADVRFRRCTGDHLSTVFDPAFQAAAVAHFADGWPSL